MGLCTRTRQGAVRAALALTLLLPTAAALRAAPEAVSALTSPSVEKIGGKKLSQWIADLRNSDPSVREEAIRSIALFGPAAASAVPALVDRLHDSDTSPCAKAIVALTMVKINDGDRACVMAALGEKVRSDSQALVRYNAAIALTMLGKDTKEAMFGLIAGMEDQSSWEIRRAAIAAVITAGATKTGPDPRVTRALLIALQDRAAQVRLEAVLALGQMGRPDNTVLRDHTLRLLKGMVNDRDKTVDIWARLSLMALVDKIDDADMAYIAKCTKSTQLQRVRVQAVRAMGGVATKYNAYVPPLVDLLSDNDPVVASAACTALGRLHDPEAKVVKALTDLSVSKDADEQVKKAAQQALDGLKKAKKK